MTPEAGSGGTRRLNNGDMTVQMAGSLGRQVGKRSCSIDGVAVKT